MYGHGSFASQTKNRWTEGTVIRSQNHPALVAIVLTVAGIAQSGAADAPIAINAIGTSPIPDHPKSETVIATTSDSVQIYGETYFGSLDARAPLILLFHQGGSNGRGEYAPLSRWLNDAGFRAIAWDQRSGGEIHGETNRTVAGLPRELDPGYCDAYPDLQAALDYTVAAGSGKKVFVWGSSYSASLIFRLAAENPERVAGVVAFSPASGGPMVECRARQWVDRVDAPVFVLRPAPEMARDSSIEQRDILTSAGADFLVVENGVHGSSMLVDDRTGHNMGATREAVSDWLGRHVDPAR